MKVHPVSVPQPRNETPWAPFGIEQVEEEEVEGGAVMSRGVVCC